MDIVKEAGTSFAFPSSTTYFRDDVGMDAERGRQAEERVKEWRTKGALPFPDLDGAQRAALENGLDYPPKALRRIDEPIPVTKDVEARSGKDVEPHPFDLREDIEPWQPAAAYEPHLRVGPSQERILTRLRTVPGR